MTLHIDPQFRDLIPPPSIEERAQLEANIVRDGCVDPLIVWDGTIIDGHNRYEICTRLGIKFTIHEMRFADREAAMDWIDSHQLGRRNLTPIQMSLLRGRIYNRAKKAVTNPAGINKSVGGQNDRQPKTAELIADRLGVAEATVRRDGRLASAVETLKAVDPDIERKAAKGEIPSRQTVIKAAETSSTDATAAKKMIDRSAAPPAPPATPKPLTRVQQLAERAYTLTQRPDMTWHYQTIRNAVAEWYQACQPKKGS